MDFRLNKLFVKWPSQWCWFLFEFSFDSLTIVRGINFFRSFSFSRAMTYLDLCTFCTDFDCFAARIETMAVSESALTQGDSSACAPPQRICLI